MRGVLRIAVLVGLCAWGGLSGWWQLWPFLGLAIIILAVNLTTIIVRNPMLLRERLKPDRPEKKWDKLVMALWSVLALAVVVVAGLDVLRYQWSVVSRAAMAAAGVLFLAGDVLIAWCMSENPFLERTVRVQQERAHRVITTGPYRFVRHPMYAGIIVMSLGWPLLLGSWLAMIPTLLMDMAVVVRTHLEDRAPHDELEGYRAYVLRTPHRLFPGVW